MKKPRSNFLKEFKTDTFEVFTIVRSNEDRRISRIILYTLITIFIPLLFIIDFVRWVIKK